MKYRNRLVFSIVYLVLGVVFIALGVAEVVDSFWSGFGGALVAVGALNLYKQIRYRKDEEYRELVDTEQNDERNKFISGRAWAWSGYIFVLIAAVATIVLKIMELEVLSFLCAMAVCLLLVIYLIVYMILRHKY